jgi:hypothetical protein
MFPTQDRLALPINRPFFKKRPGLFPIPSPIPPPFIAGVMPMKKGGKVKAKKVKGYVRGGVIGQWLMEQQPLYDALRAVYK